MKPLTRRFAATALLILLSSAAQNAVAGPAGSGHEVHIPVWALFVQTFNVIILLSILFLLLRKGAVIHFANRAKEYTDLVQRAEAAKQKAELGHREIKERLDKLESGAEASLVQARREADELKIKMIGEARTVSERLKSEAQHTVATEIEKAKAELRADLLQSALATSQEVLKSSLSSSEQAKLQNEFVQKIQVVGG
jgi:F-type H+-transporting ATPase subunit b